MKNKALVVWVIALLLFGMAVGAQAESVENALFFQRGLELPRAERWKPGSPL